MKKLFLLVIFAVASVANAQIGHFKLGANVALPVSDLSNFYSISVGADVAYMFNVAPSFDVGLVSGYQYFFGEDLNFSKTGDLEYDKLVDEFKKIPNSWIIPLAIQLKYNATPKLFVSTDLGLSIGKKDDMSTSFYYQPRVGYQVNQHEIALGYRGFSRNGQGSGAVSLGYAYNF
ncbi:hypothetical protein [Ornithobacterium rhinotracheale]